ncbi:MAG: hypothetical protein A2Y67_03320 [Candidatus Buchananbacteria bacterium RBG_13_39_9]|uniref:bAvd-like domain-containing protein n=1 Tax=Candidatus Buchananbacteria bacterium RBG_13_39_9 TaxID=1797531 RepID=A0A1G1XSP8_9BACT|nr:MAG: hypothetical protein A2Y67_03320 [Candidatus Buchananbacteria bacterium RBG_13_39_9]
MIDFNHNEISLIQKSYDLYKTIYQLVKNFPKSDKYNLGHELKILNLQIIELLIEAESAKKDWKSPPVEKASAKLGLLKIFIRLSSDLKIIDPKKYLGVQEQLQEIGRMIGGWLKSLK